MHWCMRSALWSITSNIACNQSTDINAMDTLHVLLKPRNLYLVQDYCQGKELFDQICKRGTFTERDAAGIIHSVVDAVHYLHTNDIVHRDIKAENILYVTDPKTSEDLARSLVIADFGLSRVLDPNKFNVLLTQCGTAGYMAPEVLRQIPYSKAVDMWSIGVLAYFLQSGRIPFDADTTADEMARILNAEFSFTPTECWASISDHAKDFITQCLQLDPMNRITAEEALRHPWFNIVQDTSTTNTTQPAPETLQNLLPMIRTNFDARRMWKKGIDAVQFMQKLSNASLRSNSDPNIKSAEVTSATSNTPTEEKNDHDDNIIAETERLSLEDTQKGRKSAELILGHFISPAIEEVPSMVFKV